MAKDVTEPNRPVPPTHEGMDLSRKQDPMVPVSGYAGAHVESKKSNQEVPKKDFKLPEKVPTDEMKTMGKRYGNTW